jgi:hypothetical protein
MGEQKNLFLAIGLSIAIIVIFQLLFPQQALVDKTIIKDLMMTRNKLLFFLRMAQITLTTLS